LQRKAHQHGHRVQGQSDQVLGSLLASQMHGSVHRQRPHHVPHREGLHKITRNTTHRAAKSRGGQPQLRNTAQRSLRHQHSLDTAHQASRCSLAAEGQQAVIGEDYKTEFISKLRTFTQDHLIWHASQIIRGKAITPHMGGPSHHNHSHTINHLIYHNDCTIRTTITIRCHKDTGGVSNCFIQLSD